MENTQGYSQEKGTSLGSLYHLRHTAESESREPGNLAK
jgi:hypothetical protein